MGIFNFLKKQKESIVLDITEVNKWLDKYIERQEMGTRLAIIKREIGSKASKLKELLEILRNSQLKNPQVYPERALNVMEGNRNSYIQKIETFLKNLQFPERYDDIKPFLEEISAEIEKLAIDTQKNFFILKEFMENDVSSVANKIAELDKIVANARTTLENTALDVVKEIKNEIDAYHATQQEIYSLRKDAQKIEDTKLGFYERRAKLEDKISKLKQSVGFSDLQSIVDKKDKIKEQLKKTESVISSLISDVEPALKKYAKSKKDASIIKYLKEPIKTFTEDEKLKIIAHFKKVLKEIDSLDLKDAKKDRIQKKLEKVEEAALEKTREKIIKLTQEFDEITNRIKNHSVKLNIKEQEGWMQSTDKDIESEDEKLKEIEYRLERLNPALSKQKIRDLLRKLDENVDVKK